MKAFLFLAVLASSIVANADCKSVSTAAVTQAFKGPFNYISEDTNLKDLFYNSDRVGGVLMKNWGDCRIDLNPAWNGFRHNSCVTPKCIASVLRASQIR